MNKKPQTTKNSLKNIVYLLSMIHKASPFRVPLEIFFSIVDNLMNFCLGVLLIRYIFNSFSNQVDFVKVLITVGMLYLLRIFLSFFKNIYSEYYKDISNTKITAYIQKMLYQKSVNVDLVAYDDPAFYDAYIKSMNESATRAFEILNLVSRLIGTACFIIFSSYILFTISPIIFLVLLVPIIFGGIVSKFSNKLGFESYNIKIPYSRTKDYTNRTFFLREYAKDIRITNVHRLLYQKYKKAAHEIISLTKTYGKKLSMLQYVFFLSNEIFADVFVFIYASYSVLVSKTMLLGDFFVAIDSLGDLAWAFRDVVDIVITLYQNSLYINNLKEFLNYESEIDCTTEAEQPGIKEFNHNAKWELKQVCYRYPNEKENTLKNINLTIAPGTKIALVGNNGTGKSTLIKVLMRLYDVTDGQIVYDGKNIKEYAVSSYRNMFGTMFQNSKLFALTVAENMMQDFAAADNEEELNNTLKQVGLEERFKYAEKGVRSVITKEYDENGMEFSQGEQQKLILARLITVTKDIVILDEPSSSLDPIAEHKIFELILEVLKDKTVIFISHRLSSAILADKVLLMENGMIVEEGSHDELMNMNKKYARMFKHQAANYN